MALKNFMNLAMKYLVAPSHCAAILVGDEARKVRPYYVPLKFLSTILAVLKEEELEPNIDDGPLRIDCSTDFFDQMLKALHNDKDTLSLLANDDFRNLCCIASS